MRCARKWHRLRNAHHAHAGTCDARGDVRGQDAGFREDETIYESHSVLSLSLSALRGTPPGQDADFQEDETIYDALRLEELDQVMPAAAMLRVY